MKRLLLSTALPIVFGALYFGTLQPADAAPTVTDLTYTIADQYPATGPTITSILSINGLALPATLGVESTIRNFFTLNPTQASGLTWDGLTPFHNCIAGTGCVGTTETTNVTVNFGTITVNGLAGGAQTFGGGSVTGVFTAQYDPKLAALPCSIGDGGPNPGQSDCLVWNGAANTYNGFIEKKIIGANYQLDLFLYNASDWSITPTIGFEIEALAAPAPEPNTIALLGFGLLGTLAAGASQGALRHPAYKLVAGATPKHPDAGHTFGVPTDECLDPRRDAAAGHADARRRHRQEPAIRHQDARPGSRPHGDRPGRGTPPGRGREGLRYYQRAPGQEGRGDAARFHPGRRQSPVA